MDKGTAALIAGADRKQAQVLFVDGHKITVTYSEQENPSAIRAIRDALLNNIFPPKF